MIQTLRSNESFLTTEMSKTNKFSNLHRMAAAINVETNPIVEMMKVERFVVEEHRGADLCFSLTRDSLEPDSNSFPYVIFVAFNAVGLIVLTCVSIKCRRASGGSRALKSLFKSEYFQATSTLLKEREWMMIS